MVLTVFKMFAPKIVITVMIMESVNNVNPIVISISIRIVMNAYQDTGKNGPIKDLFVLLVITPVQLVVMELITV